MFLDLFPETIFGFVHDSKPRQYQCREQRLLKEDTLDKSKSLGYGSFFTPNGIGETKNPDPKSRFLRWDGNISRLNACFADFDHGTKESQLKAIESVSIKPSIIVESKRGFHAYWLLKDTPVTPATLSLWRRIQTTIATNLHGDKACSNPSRLMRLPGSYHLKGEPFMVTVYSLSNAAYTLTDMELEFPPPTRAIYVPTSKKHRKQIFVPPIEALHDGERHPTLNKVAGKLYAHVSPEDFPLIREALKAWYSLSCVNLKPDWEEEVAGVCEWVESQESSKA